MAHQDDGRLVDLQSAARLLHVSRWTIRRLVDSGQLPVVRLPFRDSHVRRVLFDRADLERLIARSKETEPQS
jgi:excisionase family DNA binding protein